MILERDLTAQSLLREIGGIVGDNERRLLMSEAAKRLSKKDAAAEIAEIVIGRYAA